MVCSSSFSSGSFSRTSSKKLSGIEILKVNLYYNCTSEVGILSSRQKKYELLENMKNPSYIGQNKYENLEEPSRTSHTRYSYFFNTFVKRLPDFHTYSISLLELARFAYFFSLLVKICQIVILFQSSQNFAD